MDKKNPIPSQKAEGTNSQDEKSINILVVGDWIVDEDWVMMPERSETSAKQSDEKHFHTAFTRSDVATKRLCGASLTASALRGYLKSKDPTAGKYNVFGMGVWHPKDNKYMEHLFKTDALKEANPFKICSPDLPEIEQEEEHLFNLAREGDICATTRVVRSFIGHKGTLPRSMSRYDWHLKWEPKQEKMQLNDIIKQRVKQNIDKIRIKVKKGQLDAVVLADFNKGLISKELVLYLSEEIQYLKSPSGFMWFYRSKQLKPLNWSKDLKLGENDRVIQFIDPRIGKKFAEGKTLIYESEITADGLHFLETHKPDVAQAKIAVLFQDNSCIAYEAKEDNLKSLIWVLYSGYKMNYLTRGRSSIFLASLVIMELSGKKNYLIDSREEYNFGQNCSIALSNGIQWCDDCVEIWNAGSDISRVSADIGVAIKSTEPGPNIKMSGPYEWASINDEWDKAQNVKNSACIYRENHNPRLEVWRAHTVLNDYTVLDEDRKKNILNLTNVIQTFLELDEKDKQRPLISLVKAGPGSGKTFLAKCLARNFSLELFECNVAQLTSLDGLIHFFDQVDIAQREGRKILMFLDEVDSLVNGESAFSFLLELMWCGQYYRNGLKNTLKPFPGIFAMSRDQSSIEFKNDHPKFPDLKSRIYGINCELEDFTSIESIYLFAKLLDRYFGQIAYVEKYVLEVVSKTKLKYGPRSLELLISLLKEIKRDSITRENLPDENRIQELEEHFPKGLGKPVEKIEREKKEGEKMVKIIYTSPFHE